MQLTETQQASVRGWIESGKSLSEVQNLLRSEYNLNFTYMDVRFLVDDLSLELKTPAKPVQPEKKAEPTGSADEDADEVLDLDPVGEPATGGVKVTVDRITRPGAVVSGQVTFSDGQHAQWSLDQMGRLGLAGTPPGYKPGQQDIMGFQQQLQELLARSGM